MNEISKDPVLNAIILGIKEDIVFTYEQKRFRACVLLIYSGIDTMAWISMPQGQEDVTKTDFIAWSNKYIRFNGPQQLTGEDLYGARCALLHYSGVRSRLSRGSKCRMIGYLDKSSPEIMCDPNIRPDFALVSILGLKEAFSRGVDRFLVDMFSEASRRPLLEHRLQQMVMMFPVAGGDDGPVS